jgi:glutamate-1-semialdehyde 2,1-aminomutase
MTAGLASLGALTPEKYAYLERLGARLEIGIQSALAENGVQAQLQRWGSMWTLFFSPSTVEDYESAKKSDTARFGRFFHAMLHRGFYLPPSQFEAAFISLAHTEADIDATIQAIHESLKEI